MIDTKVLNKMKLPIQKVIVVNISMLKSMEIIRGNACAGYLRRVTHDEIADRIG